MLTLIGCVSGGSERDEQHRDRGRTHRSRKLKVYSSMTSGMMCKSSLRRSLRSSTPESESESGAGLVPAAPVSSIAYLFRASVPLGRTVCLVAGATSLPAVEIVVAMLVLLVLLMSSKGGVVCLSCVVPYRAPCRSSAWAVPEMRQNPASRDRAEFAVAQE